MANVLTEHLYKRTGEVPLHKQNALLYTCGVCFNGVAFVLFAPSQSGGGGGFFHGYSGWTVLVIMSQGISGYLVGALFKYIDAIAAIYADLAVSATDRLCRPRHACIVFFFFRMRNHPPACRRLTRLVGCGMPFSDVCVGWLAGGDKTTN